ncbi:regulatory LuxR family protein [Jatrophihabitans sp. GAS493]|uniref:helix-turn-helix transcriptional regulator n=1 Tax=Jatrophihabitans sp. GAS493 TaxID=1907575 RepID=UPI000BB99F1D|nr:LuxR family transcriptional regulator [Jatrophihabitans sp. GAS493]SOD70752.1 regulatory LuxR family protein [Jatrophihabitans sp. GAS493]
MLTAIGLTQEESALYRELVAIPVAEVEQLAAVLETTQAECAQLLQQLEARGLASPSLTYPGAYVAVAPDLALRGALVARQADLHRAEAEVAALARIYHLGGASRVTTDVIDVVSGWEEVQRRGYQVNEAAEQQISTTFKNPMLRGSRELAANHVDASKRGVLNRMIFEGDGLDPSELSWGIRQVAESNSDIRVFGSVPARMMIADHRLGLVALDDRHLNQVGAALIVHPSGLLDAMVGLFDMLWAVALPVNHSIPPGSGISAIENRVMNLLVAGFTDRAIAGILKTSERSIQRHVRRMMDEVGAQSRVQLGWQAAKAGWLVAAAQSGSNNQTGSTNPTGPTEQRTQPKRPEM